MQFCYNPIIAKDGGHLYERSSNSGFPYRLSYQYLYSRRHCHPEYLRHGNLICSGGDLSLLCGIRVEGSGSRYSGQWNCIGREQMDIPTLSALPSDHPRENEEFQQFCAAWIAKLSRLCRKSM